MAKEKLSRFPLSKDALNDVFHRSSITKIGPEIPHTHLQWREIVSSDTQPGRDLPATHPRAPSAPDLGGEGAGLGGAGAGGDAWPRPLRAPPSRGRPACPRRPLPRASRAGARAASRRGRRRPGLSDPAAGLPERREAGGRAQRLELGLDPGPGRSSTSLRGGDARWRRRRPGVAEHRGIPSHPGAGARSGRGGRNGSRSPHDGPGRAALP